MFNETFTTGTLKEIRCTRKEERKPDEDIPSTERIHVEARSRIITESKDSMFLPVKEVSLECNIWVSCVASSHFVYFRVQF
jgi:hypothetical protein